MNEKFFSLPQEKQLGIINAGYKVFSQNSFRKSPVSEIADAAGISKSLLFHYFHNKLELYLFLWEKCCSITVERLTQYHCYEQRDLFESMSRGMQAKLSLIREYPYMANFVLRAFYEKDPEVCAAIQKSYQKHFEFKAAHTFLNLDPEQFIPGLDLTMMYKDMYWASEGYLWEMMQRGDVDYGQIEKDFTDMIEFWKTIYLRKED